MSRRAGISPQYLSEIERGVKEPSSEMIAAVAGALGLTLLDLTSAVTGDLYVAAPTRESAPGLDRAGPGRLAGVRPVRGGPAPRAPGRSARRPARPRR
nr:helix-turn-helix transcriptional regulator [Nocardioides convexus]